MNNINAQEDGILDKVIGIKNVQEICRTLGTLYGYIDIWLDARLMKRTDSRTTGDDDSLLLMLLYKINALIQRGTITHNKHRHLAECRCITLPLQERGSLLQMIMTVSQRVDIVVKEAPARFEQVKLALYLIYQRVQLGRMIMAKREVASRPECPLRWRASIISATSSCSSTPMNRCRLVTRVPYIRTIHANRNSRVRHRTYRDWARRQTGS